MSYHEILCSAIQENNLYAFKTFFDDAKISEFELNNLLQTSLKYSNIDFVKYLISKGANNLDESLIDATWNLDLKLVKYFTENGAKDICKARHMIGHLSPCCQKQTDKINNIQYFLKEKIGNCDCRYCNNNKKRCCEYIGWASWTCDECS